MLGAIIGDIVGAPYEFNNYRRTDFELFSRRSRVTDDSIMTLATARALMDTWETLGYSRGEAVIDETLLTLLEKKAVAAYQDLGRRYPDCGFGLRFNHWIFQEDPGPYDSYGNGGAMRVSPVAWLANTEEEVIRLSRTVTGVSHNHPEGLKGAEATALAIFLARKGVAKAAIKKRIRRDYYPLDFTLADIRDTYAFNETAQETVPQAMEAFLEAGSFEETLRLGVSVGGDSDTLTAIAASIAEACYGIPGSLREKALTYLDEDLRSIYDRWQTFMRDR